MNGLAASPLVWLALAAAGVLWVLAGRDKGNADVRRRLASVSLRMLRWALVPVVLVLAVPGISEDMRTALIAGLLVVAGWFATFLFQQEERAADQIDLMIGLRAEVWVFLNDLSRNVEGDPEGATMADLAAHPASAPFFPQPGPPLLFEANAGQVARLPSEVVDEVVQFYSLLGAVRQFALELRDPVFLARPAAVRGHAYRTYFKSYRDLAVLARDAVVSLNRAIGVPSPEAFGETVSTPDPARSDPPAKVSDVSDRKP